MPGMGADDAPDWLGCEGPERPVRTGTGIKQTPAKWLAPESPGRGRAPGPAPRSSGARAADAARRPGCELPRCPLATLGCSRTFGLLNELLPSFAAQEGGAQTPAHRVPPPVEVVPSHVLSRCGARPSQILSV